MFKETIIIIAILFFSFLLETKSNFQNELQKNVHIQSGSIKNIKKQSKFNFRTGEMIGFQYNSEFGDYLSISGITISDDYAFIGDQFYQNIKRIDLLSGEILSNKKNIMDKDVVVWDLITFNQYIYTISWNKTICIFDKDLNKITEFNNPEIPASKTCIYNISKDTLDLRTYYNSREFRILLDKNNNMYKDTLYLSDQEFFKKISFCDSVIQGKKYNQIEKDGKIYLVNDYGVYLLPFKLEGNDYYECPFFDFTKDRIVFFNITPHELTLYVYEY